MRILHAADLHLSAKTDSDYGLEVLREIVSIAQTQQIDAVLLCGDVFDTFESFEQLRRPVREIAEPLRGKIFMIPGNHEDLGRVGQDLALFDLGAITLFSSKPYTLHQMATGEGLIEILAIPHQSEAFDYRVWQLPPKTTRIRLAMAHGLVQGMSYTGPAEVEEGGASLDPDMFARFSVDYVALGHIHSKRTERCGATVLAYSGSARVWRRGEVGERSVNIVTCSENGSDVQAWALKSAGLYRYVEVPLHFDGQFPQIDTAAWGAQDFIELKLSGLVEDEIAAKTACYAVEQALKTKVRKLVIDRDDLLVFSGIAKQPLAERFLQLWEKNRPSSALGDLVQQDRQWQVWMRTRELVLTEMKKLLENS